MDFATASNLGHLQQSVVSVSTGLPTNVHLEIWPALPERVGTRNHVQRKVKVVAETSKISSTYQARRMILINFEDVLSNVHHCLARELSERLSNERAGPADGAPKFDNFC